MVGGLKKECLSSDQQWNANTEVMREESDDQNTASTWTFAPYLVDVQSKSWVNKASGNEGEWSLCPSKLAG